MENSLKQPLRERSDEPLVGRGDGVSVQRSQINAGRGHVVVPHGFADDGVADAVGSCQRSPRVAADIRGERFVQADELREVVQAFVVHPQGAVVAERAVFAGMKDGEDVRAGGTGRAILVDDALGVRVNPYLEGAVGLVPAIDDAAVSHLCILQMGDVDKRHALRVEAEEEQVARELQLRVGQADGEDASHHLGRKRPLARFSCPVNALRKGWRSSLMSSSSTA